MKKFIILLVTVAIIAAITNPDSNRHREILKTELRRHLEVSLTNQDGNFWKKAGAALGKLIGGAAIDFGVDEMIVVEDYALFSLSTITWNGSTKVVGIGAFGQVFLIRDLEDVIPRRNRNSALDSI